MTSEPTPPETPTPQPPTAQPPAPQPNPTPGTPDDHADADRPDDPSNADGRMPSKVSRREVTRVVIKITGVKDLLEIEGDDVDLGSDLKVRYKHHLVAEFRRDAVDGWWFKTFVLNQGPPFGGEGDATDVGDLAATPDS
ncbi:MAG: hypothetical protein DK306_000961 [Chloroflexi bacterium]|nr:MAG: hypothetical protein DK306_000961 [Chloroflexota bacterium]